VSNAKDKWLRQEQAVRATQMAFDLSSEVQKSIKKQAIDQELTPSDMIRKILSLDLNDEEIALLAERFGVAPDDKRAVKQQVAELLIARTSKR
jgi:hypothetical protein